MKIRSGGVMVPDEGKFYGINPEEFKATHSVKDDSSEKVAKTAQGKKM